MAVSNTIGSNVFDILVGLGIPWGLQTMVINYGSTVSSSCLLNKRARRQACACHGNDGAVGLSQPGALGATLPPSPWHPRAHFPRRLPEQPEGCLQGRPREPSSPRCFCPVSQPLPGLSPPGPFLRQAESKLEPTVSWWSTATCSPGTGLPGGGGRERGLQMDGPCAARRVRPVCVSLQVKINSRGLVYSVVLLLGSVALTVSFYI